MADPFDTPGYRFSVNRFPGNGSQTLFDISFAGRPPGYISQDYVKAKLVNDTTGEETALVLTPANWVLPTRLSITPAPPAGVTLEVWRDTPKDQPLLDYTDGALMIEKNLDTSNDQAIYGVAEMVDRFADALDATEEFSQEVLDRLATVEQEANTATSTSTTALATANSALAAANLAVEGANEALEAVEGAEQAAQEATQAANAANAAAATATTAANNANQAAQDATDTAADAVTTATAAVSTANNALAVANGIDAKAQSALDASASATSTANNALTVANGIDAKAQSALDTANGIDAKATQALADSATAISTANAADTKAQNALDATVALDTRTDNLESYVTPKLLPTSAHNLDDYTTLGHFLQNADAGAAAGTNYPVPWAGFLDIKSGASNILHQEYTTLPRNGVIRRFIRGRTAGGVWTFEWQEVMAVKPNTALPLYTQPILTYERKGLISEWAIGGTSILVNPGYTLDTTGTYKLQLNSAVTRTIQTSGGYTHGNSGNALVSGARQAGWWYYMFLLRRDSDGVVAVAFDTSATCANRPAGYTHYRRIGAVRTNSANTIVPYTQVGNEFWFDEVVRVYTFDAVVAGNTYSPGTGTPGPISHTIHISGWATASAGQPNLSVELNGPTKSGGRSEFVYFTVASASAGVNQISDRSIPIPARPEVPTLQVRVTGGSGNFTLWVRGYTDHFED